MADDDWMGTLADPITVDMLPTLTPVQIPSPGTQTLLNLTPTQLLSPPINIQPVQRATPDGPLTNRTPNIHLTAGQTTASNSTILLLMAAGLAAILLSSN